MNENVIASEFERVKDKFGNIHKEFSQTVDEARNKIEVKAPRSLLRGMRSLLRFK